jgi:hypothetical protein
MHASAAVECVITGSNGTVNNDLNECCCIVDASQHDAHASHRRARRRVARTHARGSAHSIRRRHGTLDA